MFQIGVASLLVAGIDYCIRVLSSVTVDLGELGSA